MIADQDYAHAASSTQDKAACAYIIKLIYARARIRLDEGKEALIYSRLAKRMRHHGFQTLSEYTAFLERHPSDEELTKVTDALTTNFTNFLREESHFKFLVEKALPSVVGPSVRDFRIWSAACSTGEEPYSIAFYLWEHYPPMAGWNWHVLASDISTRVLAKARSGIYAMERVQSIPPAWLRNFFQKGYGPAEGSVRVKASITERVTFKQINLIETYHHAKPFDIIFCRNVMIYFDRPTQQQLVNHLCQFLVPGGFLVIGHSESLNGLELPLRCTKPSVYQKP